MTSMSVVILDRSEIYLLFVFIFVFILDRNGRHRHSISGFVVRQIIYLYIFIFYIFRLVKLIC